VANQKFHVRFDYATSIDRFIEVDIVAGDTDPEDTAVTAAASAPDDPEQWNDGDWQVQFVHPRTAKCDKLGAICWEGYTRDHRAGRAFV
jgi:hypothetical protein